MLQTSASGDSESRGRRQGAPNQQREAQCGLVEHSSSRSRNAGEGGGQEERWSSSFCFSEKVHPLPGRGNSRNHRQDLLTRISKLHKLHSFFWFASKSTLSLSRHHISFRSRIL